MAKKEVVNSFSEGLIMDLNPINTPNNVLTDCINGTFITYNGNEFILQNDQGNYKLKHGGLSDNFMPIGMKEHAGIIYIVSYNPLTKETEIGSYPSPLEILSSDAIADGTGEDTITPLIGASFEGIVIADGATSINTKIEEFGKVINNSDVYIYTSADDNSEQFKIHPGDQINITNNNEDQNVFKYQHLDYKILNEDKQLVNITNDNKIVDINEYITDTDFNYVKWQTIGWLAAKYDIFGINNHSLNIINTNVVNIQDEESFDLIVKLNSNIVIDNDDFISLLAENNYEDLGIEYSVYYRDDNTEYYIDGSTISELSLDRKYLTYNGFNFKLNDTLTLTDVNGEYLNSFMDMRNTSNLKYYNYGSNHDLYYNNYTESDSELVIKNLNKDCTVYISAVPYIKNNDIKLYYTDKRVSTELNMTELLSSSQYSIGDNTYKYRVTDTTLEFSVDMKTIDPARLVYSVYDIPWNEEIYDDKSDLLILRKESESYISGGIYTYSIPFDDYFKKESMYVLGLQLTSIDKEDVILEKNNILITSSVSNDLYNDFNKFDTLNFDQWLNKGAEHVNYSNKSLEHITLIDNSESEIKEVTEVLNNEWYIDANDQYESIIEKHDLYDNKLHLTTTFNYNINNSLGGDLWNLQEKSSVLTVNGFSDEMLYPNGQAWSSTTYDNTVSTIVKSQQNHEGTLVDFNAVHPLHLSADKTWRDYENHSSITGKSYSVFRQDAHGVMQKWENHITYTALDDSLDDNTGVVVSNNLDEGVFNDLKNNSNQSLVRSRGIYDLFKKESDAMPFLSINRLDPPIHYIGIVGAGVFDPDIVGENNEDVPNLPDHKKYYTVLPYNTSQTNPSYGVYLNQFTSGGYDSSYNYNIKGNYEDTAQSSYNEDSRFYISVKTSDDEYNASKRWNKTKVLPFNNGSYTTSNYEAELDNIINTFSNIYLYYKEEQVQKITYQTAEIQEYNNPVKEITELSCESTYDYTFRNYNIITDFDDLSANLYNTFGVMMTLGETNNKISEDLLANNEPILVEFNIQGDAYYKQAESALGKVVARFNQNIIDNKKYDSPNQLGLYTSLLPGTVYDIVKKIISHMSFTISISENADNLQGLLNSIVFKPCEDSVNDTISTLFYQYLTYKQPDYRNSDPLSLTEAPLKQQIPIINVDNDPDFKLAY